eukprot:TRINITY_DN34181_c0_g1_i1.p2 TRINITY_DN34181_c0_g1~~TRINITY_DN34181_c0_g1_i1.p2  ORF type:complete len:303 (+),score=49.02 TRINITY_DN34181_c0_g1_i1:111-911(+)
MAAAMWVPDGLRPRCSACQVTFRWWRRRHHCRHCGEVFCARCSRGREAVPPEWPYPVRVCNGCKNPGEGLQRLEQERRRHSASSRIHKPPQPTSKPAAGSNPPTPLCHACRRCGGKVGTFPRCPPPAGGGTTARRAAQCAGCGAAACPADAQRLGWVRCRECRSALCSLCSPPAPRRTSVSAPQRPYPASPARPPSAAQTPARQSARFPLSTGARQTPAPPSSVGVTEGSFMSCLSPLASAESIGGPRASPRASSYGTPQLFLLAP